MLAQLRCERRPEFFGADSWQNGGNLYIVRQSGEEVELTVGSSRRLRGLFITGGNP